MATVKAGPLRDAIADMQLDFGLAETVEDYEELAFKHFGPESYFTELRWDMEAAEEDK